MCLAVPVQVAEIKDENTVLVGSGDNLAQASTLMLVDKPKVGDYVLVHAGFIINVLDINEAKETLKLFQQMAEHADNTVCF